ncbi:rhodanese-related sulfurtransferase [Flavobacterium gossypii]|uniref:Rhodanese-related sulfurtransferase n=1 Tax=Flavobacterium gossypii TaxID=1646119 RepID=A0ABR6DRX9_9FLAO|nr:rhodanese-like domain-containing protein [Flavobacterium gossypii]MBA9074445.1 rhodanese-related sulfurtransferase [Flavobacterium gossypii]
MKTRLFSLLLLLISFASCQSQSKSPELVSPEVFAKKTEAAAVQLVDVRTPKEYKQGHLKGAENIHLYDQDFVDRINKLDKTKPVYVYCKAGGRSAEAVEIMQAQGFQNIIELKGGTDSWTESGKPLEQ